MLKFTTSSTLFMAVAASAAGVSLGAVTVVSDGVGEGGLRGSLVAVTCMSHNGGKFRTPASQSTVTDYCNGPLVEVPPFEVVKSRVRAGCEVDGDVTVVACRIIVRLECKGSSETK